MPPSVTKPRSSRLSAPELDLLSLLDPTLQGRPDPSVVREVLRLAQQRGLDPEKLYRVAVKVRSPEWPPAPSWEAVDPSLSE